MRVGNSKGVPVEGFLIQGCIRLMTSYALILTAHAMG